MALSTTAEPAFGTLLKLCTDANGTSPTTIAEVKDLNINLDAQIEDATTHSTSVPWRVAMPSTPDCVMLAGASLPKFEGLPPRPGSPAGVM